MMLGAGLPDSGFWHHQLEGRPPSRKAARERALKLRRSERAAGSAGPLPHLRLRRLSLEQPVSPALRDRRWWTRCWCARRRCRAFYP